MNRINSPVNIRARMLHVSDGNTLSRGRPKQGSGKGNSAATLVPMVLACES